MEGAGTDAGRPKGVRLGLGQIEQSASMLAQATDAAKSDVYLSVLPLLLETICAIRIATLVPFEAINPRSIWTIVILIMAISACGYVAVRALGARYGLPAAGLASGFV
jgi:uncharacterized membrane protein (DUF4010 family)